MSSPRIQMFKAHAPKLEVSMTKEQLKREYFLFLEMFGLTAEECVLGSGGAMVMIGLRETTRDLDITVPQKAFERIRLQYPYLYASGRFGDPLKISQMIDLHVPDGFVKTVITDGIVHWDVPTILAFKKRLNRPKDQKDIRVLKEFVVGRAPTKADVLRDRVCQDDPLCADTTTHQGKLSYFSSLSESLKANRQSGRGSVSFEYSPVLSVDNPMLKS